MRGSLGIATVFTILNVIEVEISLRSLYNLNDLNSL